MPLKQVPGGWVNTDVKASRDMIVVERKSKYKHKVVFEPRWANSEHEPIRAWCESKFGPGGRNKHLRWRFGWTNTNSTYYFKESKDVTLFLLKWGA